MITEEQLDEIQVAWKAPFKYDQFNISVFDSENNLVCDIRSWGRLQYLGEQRATSMQDGMGQLIADLLNKHFTEPAAEQVAQ